MPGNNAEKIRINSAGQIAVIDLGSNSFQMLLAEVLNGNVIEIARFREKIQLAAGLDVNCQLQDRVVFQAYQCLQHFAEHLAGIEPSNVRAVGTDALRRAVNRGQFIDMAVELLGVPVDIISGNDEAKLIYRGAIASIDQPELVNLVLDIGGGSTEL
ncbi:MAG: exopolyphosphatase, partial [Pseudomonadales bacterium]|nr:exopolyphosphatase [Pseudomonadales bacterium]